MSTQNKIIVILGPTSSGKTRLAVKLSLKYDGEIVSADSRQVYRGMDVGTGKDLDEYMIKTNVSESTGSSRPLRQAQGPQDDNVLIPYHLIDVVSPGTEFNLAKYLKKAKKAIGDIVDRGKLPIFVGGTGLYLEALVEGFDLSQTKPDEKLREYLEKLSEEELFGKLERIDKEFAQKLNNSERNNKRRLIRHIEKKLQITNYKLHTGNEKSKFEYLLIGLEVEKEMLNNKIYKRLIYRLEEQGMVDEVKNLHKQGISWRRLESFGLEYRFVSLYLQKKIEYDEMVEKLNIAIRQFAKRQMTWFRRWEKKRKIHWVKDYSETDKLVKQFFK